MSKTVLETLTNKQLGTLLVANVIILIAFFIAGGRGPHPTNVMIRNMKQCNDKILDFERHDAPIDDDKCLDPIETIAKDDPTIIASNLVFYVVLPTDKQPEIHMSRWFQFSIGLLNIEFSQDARYKEAPTDTKAVLTYKGGIFGRDDVSDDWTPLHKPNMHHYTLQCSVEPETKILDCNNVPLYELGSVFYNYYLINLQLPVRNHYNTNIRRLDHLSITEIHQNGGFTKVYVGQKSVVCPLLLVATLLFIRQTYHIPGPGLLVNKVITALGFVNVLFNLPLEYFSLFYDVPGLRVWFDVSTGFFYAAMAMLWLLFVGEHRMDLDQRNKCSNYWKEIFAVSMCCIAMFIFDMIDRGMQLSDPFHSIWATVGGQNAARTMLLLSAACAVFYLLVLVYLMVRVVVSMSRKRASLANVGRVRQLYYEGLIFRFKFMVYLTTGCGLLSVILFCLVNVNEMYYKWGKSEETLEISSALIVGVTAMWNMYVLNILFLYAPINRGVSADAYETVQMTEVELKETALEPSDGLTALTKPSAD